MYHNLLFKSKLKYTKEAQVSNIRLSAKEIEQTNDKQMNLEREKIKKGQREKIELNPGWQKKTPRNENSQKADGMNELRRTKPSEGVILTKEAGRGGNFEEQSRGRE